MKRIGFLYLTVLCVAAQLLFLSDTWGQLIHTAHDHIPDFSANYTIASASNGSWSSPNTWSPGRVPGPNDIVRIRHTVTYDTTSGDADVIGIDVGGMLRFATNQSTRLRVGTLIVLPNGTLEIGTSSNPIAASSTAEIIIKNKALNTSTDPDQFGTGLVAIDGKVTMRGAVKTPTFVRTAAEPRAGQTVIQLEKAVSGWRAGDRLFVPDTRQVDENNKFNSNYALQIDEVTVQSVSSDGRSVTVSPALRYDHRGARDADGTPTVHNGIKLLPHVGNLSRNITIRSENPSGTRGHTLLTNRSDVEIYYVQFQDLGRTRAAPLNSSSNHIGRYPLHIHHLLGPVNSSNTGYQFEIVGNAVNDSLKWPIAVHGSHYGLIKQNVVFGGSQLTGAGIAVEDGSETENLFEENFVANIRGNVNPRDSGPNTADGTTPGSAAECFWAAGFNNRFVNNVASSCRNPHQQIVSGPGWKFIVPPGPYTTQNPRFRGADMTSSTQTLTVTPQNQAILEFRGNEVYGLAADGLTAWNLGTDGYGIQPAVMPESLIKDFRVWHTYEGAIYNYPANRMTLDGLVYRVDAGATVYWPPAFRCGDYRNVDVTIRGGSVHAGSVFGDCTDPLGTFRFENVNAVTREHAFNFRTPATPGTGADRPASGVTMILQNNTVSPWPGQALRTIEMDHDTSKANSQPNDKYEVFVYDYQGQSGNNFRVYFKEQANQNLYGGTAPCNNTTARPEADGITCPMSGSTPPPSDTIAPSIPSNLLASAISSSQINLSWTASTDNVGVTGYQVERCQGSTCTGFSQIGTPSGPSYSDTGLSANTTYRYRVRARDAVGNFSGYSSIVNGTTTSSPVPTPSVISISPSSLNFTGTVGAARPSSLTVTVSVTNGSPWASQDTCSFFNASPTSGQAGGSHILTPSAGWDSLAVGTYQCPITYSASGNTNLTVQVTAVKQATTPPVASAPATPSGLQVK